MRAFLRDLLGPDNVLDGPAHLGPYSEDYTEIPAAWPDLVALVEKTEQVQAIVRRAAAEKVPLVPRVYNTNVGGLCIPEQGGIVLDMTRINRIVEVNEADMYAVIEPGVTQRMLKEHLSSCATPLTLGYSLAPPDTSVFANALLGGLTNRSLKYGDQSQSISGLEVVRWDGTLARLGSWAVDGVLPFGRVPLPDLAGLYIGWQGTTGIATRMAFQLWPRHPLERRLFYLTYSAEATFEVMMRLCRAEICEDIGGLSWPSAKMMLGVRHPHPEPSPGDPLFFLYIDLAAEIPEEMAAKEKVLERAFDGVKERGEEVDGPLDVRDLVRVNAALGKFAEFPTDLDFLTHHGGGGLSWVGTYGPVSRFERAAEVATEIMVRRGFPPVIVSRPMRGGHYGVIRFITLFDKGQAEEVLEVRRVNGELLEALTREGFLMYKTPVWAWEKLKPGLDAGMLRLLGEVRTLLDPGTLFNPGKLSS